MIAVYHLDITTSENTPSPDTKLPCLKASLIYFSTNRSPKAALLCQLWPHTPDDPHTVHKPLPGPHHHLHHLHQRHHHVLRALQSTSCKKEQVYLNVYWFYRSVTGVLCKMFGESALGIGPVVYLFLWML